MSSTWRSNSLSADEWGAMFYTQYTTVRTAIMTPFLVAFIFVVLRVAGTRTLTQATLFNKIVLVAVGSLVGSVALRPNTPLVALVIGTLIIVGTALLVDAAYARGWLPASLVHARPILLYADGQLLTSNLQHALLSPEKLHSELRLKGYCSMEGVFAVILEPTGSWAIITKDAASKSDLSLLRDVVGYGKYLQHLDQGRPEAGQPVAAAAPAGPQLVASV